MFEDTPLLTTQEDLPADDAPADPYDGVALGVECAWPAEFQL